MFEAYKVAVKISLVNEVSKELGLMSTLFGKLGKDVDVLQSKLNKLKKVGMISGLAMGAGFLGLDLVKKSLKPAEDYAHQLNIMNMAGMKHKDIALAVAAAWKTTSTILTSTATGNLQTFMDLRNIFGDVSNGKVNSASGAAISDLPELVRIGAVLRASSNSKVSGDADALAFSIAKALDMRNAVSSPAVFNQQAEMMTKVITALQGRVQPEDYRMLFKYGRQAIPGLSNEFLYEELPTFMMEMKGKSGGGGQGGFGSSLAAGYRFFVQGIMNKRAAENLSELGLIPKSSILKTTTTGTTLKGGVKDSALFQYDPFAWTQSVFLPAIRKKYGDNLNNSQLTQIINQTMKGNQLAQFEILQFALKAQNVYRDQKLIKEAQNSTSAYKMALSADPTTAMAAFNAQWQNFQTAMMMGVIPVIVPALISLTKYLNEFAQWARNNPKTIKYLVLGFTALSGALVVLGAVGIISTAAAIIRVSAALTALNGALGVSGAAGDATLAARLGTVGAAAVAGAGGYLVGTYADHKLGLSKKIGFGLYDYFHPGAQQLPGNQPQQHASSGTTSQPIIIQVDGRSLMQTVLPHLNHSNYLTQIQQSNSFMTGMTPISPNTGVPFR